MCFFLKIRLWTISVPLWKYHIALFTINRTWKTFLMGGHITLTDVRLHDRTRSKLLMFHFRKIRKHMKWYSSVNQHQDCHFYLLKEKFTNILALGSVQICVIATKIDQMCFTANQPALLGIGRQAQPRGPWVHHLHFVLLVHVSVYLLRPISTTQWWILVFSKFAN